jgi:hypothetical protein
MDLNTLASISSATIAVVSAVPGGYFAHRSVRHARGAMQLQYLAELRAWAREAAEVLSVAIHLCDLDPQRCKPGELFGNATTAAAGCRPSPSGGLVITNVRHEERGTHKEVPFQGFRHVIVERRFRACELAGKLNHERGRPRGD